MKKKKSKNKKPKETNERSSIVGQEEKKPFDYGGIPDRDLKKNLGCG